MFIDKLLSLIIGLLFLLVLSCDGPSSNSGINERTAHSKNKPLHKNPVFWDYAAISNMLQVELGRIAIEKNTTDEVKDLGKNAVAFHNKALQQLKTMTANLQDIHLPDSLGNADRDLVKEFILLEGEEFANRYKKFIVDTHRMQLQRYKEALARAEKKNVQDWLQIMLLHVNKELQEASGRQVAEL